MRLETRALFTSPGSDMSFLRFSDLHLLRMLTFHEGHVLYVALAGNNKILHFPASATYNTLPSLAIRYFTSLLVLHTIHGPHWQ